MSVLVQTATRPQAIAAKVESVSKIFYQKQQAQRLRDYFHPQKKAIAALDTISFTVKRGEFTAYAGPNGAGKSTTIKLMAGMLVPTAGQVQTLGLSPQRERTALMKRLGVLFGNRTELWWDHPIASSFRWKQRVWDIPQSDFAHMEKLVLEMLDIGPFYHTFARELSLGQRMRADLGMMLLNRPELILLDEPTLGLDVLAKRRMIEFLKDLNRREGTTILVTSHDMDDLEEMADRILLIAKGRTAFDGDFQALRQQLGLQKKAVVSFSDGTEKVYPYSDTREVLKTLSGVPGVVDMRFTQTTLEEGIANLFKRL